MPDFRVWAPDAANMRLVLGTPNSDGAVMTRTDGGWWAASVECESGADYGYRIDGGPVRPDPRSRRQPYGVHECSRLFDPATYNWGDESWTGRQLAGSVIYELHIGTFTPGGTFNAAIEKLDYLVDLGIDLVELLPVNDFNGPRNWGYDGTLWYAVHEEYGGPAGYQRFVDACHARGLGVIQDVVYNHLGASGNYLPEFGPYVRDDAANTWGAVVNLDGPESDEVRRYILDNAHMWFADYHVDGLRLDAVHALVDTRAMTLLEELAIETESLAAHLGRPLSLIAESDLNDPRLYVPRAAGGDGLTAAWSDDFHHAAHVAVTGETAGYYADFATPGALAKVLTRGYFHDGTYSSFRERHHGRPIETATTPASRLVVCIQDHDQIGNRAAGDRINQQADDTAQLLAAVLLLTSPCTPMLFMGEEWAASTPWQFFTSHPQPELAEKTRQGRIAEFAGHDWDVGIVPDPQDPQTFERSVLRWGEQSESAHARVLGKYRELLRLRRSRPELTDPRWDSVHVDHVDDGRGIVVSRGIGLDQAGGRHANGGGTVIVVNLAAQPLHLGLGRISPSTDADSLLFATDDSVEIDGVGDITLPARSAVILGAP